MPAKSKQQQKFFGVVKSMQKGDTPKKGEAGEVADDMTNKEVDKMASTKHKNLPGKVKKESISITTLKEMVKEEYTKIIKEAKSVDKIKKDLVKTIDALKKNIPLFLSAKKSGDINKSNKYKDVAIKLTKLKKKLEAEMDKALGNLHSDAELELEYQDPRADADESVNEAEEFKKGTKIAIKSPKGRSHDVDMYIVKYTGDGYFYTDAGERSSEWIDEEELMKLLKTKKAVVD